METMPPHRQDRNRRRTLRDTAAAYEMIDAMIGDVSTPPSLPAAAAAAAAVPASIQ
jgi:hypothetical protein